MSNILAKTREEIISNINQMDLYDLVIIGGGIHGAVSARLAALAGLKTLLLEKNDYASATSSRSSKMAHGGLRYLEMFDFQQVFEGVKSRDKLYKDFPDLVQPHPFYIPVYQRDFFFKLKLGIGLKLYDRMLSNAEHYHHWVNQEEALKLIPELGSHKLTGCYCYYDGIMNDYRLVIRNILEARTNKADCLNYAFVENVRTDSSQNTSEIYWRDTNQDQLHSVKTKTVLNVTGPWVGKNSTFDIKFSQGSHILFSRPWKAPALFLPMPEKARYYFVWPHFAGTLVGTTERVVHYKSDDPQPTKDEIEEIYHRLEKDLPNSGLNRETAHYAFAGIRTLVLRNNHKNVAQLSRKHIWNKSGNVFSLYGGKFTTAEWTAREGLKLVLNYLDQNLIDFNSQLSTLNLPEDQLKSAFEYEQALTLEDYLRRRSDIEYLPGNGFKELPELQKTLGKYIPQEKLTQQINQYKKRIKEIRHLLN